MKISFLVTYYNQKEYVKQSMDSILAIEKPCDWEILVGDDGSNDGTIDLVNEYVKQYPDNIKLYIMPRETDRKYDSVKRASANRLNILAHSTGDIFCTLDGDDFYCDTTFIKEAINVFENNKDVSIVAFGYRYVIDETLGREFLLPSSMTNQYVDKRVYLRKYYLPAGGCVHRKCFNNNRIEFIKSLEYFDDNNIVINSLNYGEMFLVNRSIYAYRQTGQSVYTSMNALEQAVLNVQGMDVDLRLIDDELKQEIIERYSSALILMYIWKSEIQGILGTEKCKKYKDGCSTFATSYCRSLLEYAELPEDQKVGLRIELKHIMHSKVLFTVKQTLKYWLRGD